MKLRPAPDSPERVLRTVTLSTDRTQYDPSSELALRYDWDDNRDHAAILRVDIVDAAGLARPLTLRTLPPPAATTRTIPVQAHTLLTFSLRDLFDGEDPVRLDTGGTLLLTLQIAATDPSQPDAILEPTTIVAVVDVSAQPVTPVPQAAYALLRGQTVGGLAQVECVRFAWSPPATRVELVCPDDLRRGIVRRRAVFLWNDTARAGTANGFAVQKITLTGSTHFPSPNVLGDGVAID